MNNLDSILSLIEKPLIFASRNSFANLPHVRGIDTTVRQIVEKIDPGLRPLLSHIESKLKGFDLLSLDQRKIKVVDAINLINDIRHDKFVDKAPESELYEIDVISSSKAVTSPVRFIKGVGPRIAELLLKKGIHTIEDLFYFIPRTYQDRRIVKKARELEAGKVETVAGIVIAADVIGFKGGRKKIFELMLKDETGIIIGKWFRFNQRYIMARFKKGERIIMTGEVMAFGAQKEMHHPDTEVYDESDKLNFGRIVPLYSLTEGLGDKTVRRIMHQAVMDYADKMIDGIPRDTVMERGFMPLKDALRGTHFPDSAADMESLLSGRTAAHRRLAFDEFFFLELGLALKHKGVAREKGMKIEKDCPLIHRLKEKLPFRLTEAQIRVIDEILSDMSIPHPMNRLVQGDVGCGKTIVALISILAAVGSGYQAVIMAPTEILAEQHYLSIHSFAESLGLKMALLTGNVKGKERDGVLAGIRTGVIHIAVGTHAVIQESVDFKSLALAVIDEQHRFGVVQRGLIKKKGDNPHILVMTATPIPRTLAMTVYGDLDLSVINELPPGRSPIKTKIYNERERDKVYALIRKELQTGRQAFIVYPLVEGSEKSDLMDATNMSERLRGVFPEFRIGLLHGRMGYDEKEKTMLRFRDGEVDILVATTVIEVGIDIPNASIMLIEHAERFGLSQLHQLRGRVGRGTHDSHCLLLAQYKRSEDAWKRLKIMEETTDGFRIAEADLEIRGPGDFLGTRQAGLPDFRVGNILRDADILEDAKSEAFKTIEGDPELAMPEHRIMKEVLHNRWAGRLSMAGIA